MKKALIILASLAGVAIVAYIVYSLSKKPSTDGKVPPTGKPVDVQPAPANVGQSQILSREVGDGKTLFDAYRKKFVASEVDRSEALRMIDPYSIFDGTNNKAWLDRVAKFNIPIPFPTAALQNTVAKLAKLDYANGLWGTVDSIRGANFQLVPLGTNMLPGNPEVNSDAFVSEIMCAYTGCPSNAKKRNDAAAAISGKVGEDFKKIMVQWDAYNTAANIAMDEYVISRLTSAGYKIV